MESFGNANWVFFLKKLFYSMKKEISFFLFCINTYIINIINIIKKIILSKKKMTLTKKKLSKNTKIYIPKTNYLPIT